MDRVAIEKLTDAVIAGHRVTSEQARALGDLTGAALWDLFHGADRIRHHCVGDKVHLCAIVNAKSGGCTEDCSFCSQSASFSTDVEEYDFLSDQEIAVAAERSKHDGAEALGMVAAWRGLEEGPLLDRVVASVRTLADRGDIKADASLGIIESPAVANKLAEAGLHCYNHNLETSRDYFDTICSSHSYDERIKTITLLKEAGINVCSGVLIGMGESWDDRVAVAMELRELEVDKVPINFLNRIDGTPLAQREPLPPLEALQAVAMLRFVLPKTEIMVAGGRETVLGDLQSLMFHAGASAIMIGNYLTTSGRSAEDDKAMIRNLGLHY